MPRFYKSNWTGSERTYKYVLAQIIKRWGEKETQYYNPRVNCLTFNKWLKRGYKVKKGEKALRSFISIDLKDKEGKVIGRVQKPISLFYRRQVEKIKKKKDEKEAEKK